MARAFHLSMLFVPLSYPRAYRIERVFENRLAFPAFLLIVFILRPFERPVSRLCLQRVAVLGVLFDHLWLSAKRIDYVASPVPVSLRAGACAIVACRLCRAFLL